MSFQNTSGGKNNGKKKRKMKEETGGSREESREESSSAPSRDPRENLASASPTIGRGPEIRTASGKEMAERAAEYLEEFHMETKDVFRNVETFEAFEEKAQDQPEEEWEETCLALRNLSRRHSRIVGEMSTSEEVCGRCRGGSAFTADLVSTQFMRLRWALRAAIERYRGARQRWEKILVRDLSSEQAKWEAKLRSILEEKKEAERERDQLRSALTEREEESERERGELRSILEEKKEAERERDQLRSALAEREEESGRERGEVHPPPPPNTEVEEMEVETGGMAPPPPSGEMLIPAILGALEGWFEAKWERMLSHGTRPSCAEGRDGQTTASRPDSWASAIGRKAGTKPSTRGRVTPHHQGEQGGTAGIPAAVRQGRSEGREARAPCPPPQKTGGNKRKKWPTVPETAVVAINPLPGGKQAGEELIREAQQELSLEALDIPPLEIRRSKMGGYLLGVRGQDAAAKADRLASGLRGLLGAAGVAVTRPVKRLDIRVSGLGMGVAPAEVAQSVAAAGGCSIDELQTGATRESPRGMGSLWVRCPAAAAVRVARDGGVRVGWAWAPVVLLSSRPERCYRCLELGHLRVQCTSVVDRSARCYRCSGIGHAANGCKVAVPCCPLCVDSEGRNESHTLGGPGCAEAPLPPQREPAAKTAARVASTGVT